MKTLTSPMLCDKSKVSQSLKLFIYSYSGFVHDLIYHCTIFLKTPVDLENRDVHDSAYEAACDTLLAYAPQIAHTQGFEMLTTHAPKGQYSFRILKLIIYLLQN